MIDYDTPENERPSSPTVADLFNRARLDGRSRYEGWANSQTWLINCWLENSESARIYWRCEVQVHRALVAKSPHVQSGRFTEEDALRYYLARDMREQVTDRAPIDGDGLYCELLAETLNSVDWLQIADYWLV